MCESDLVTPGIKPDWGVSEFMERFEPYSQNIYISLKMKKKDKDENDKNENTNFLPFSFHCI